MKYGLIYYHNTENVGDDILSYAAKQFLPRVDYFIDREAMNLFIPNEKEYVAAILNGWYLYHTYEFPPSPYFLPLFTGTHFTKDQWIFSDYSYLDGPVTDYLKSHGPIGCRDSHTREILTQRGIDCYFSGCLTLTLKPFSDVSPTHAIVLTDVSDSVADYVRSLFPDREIIRITHMLTPEEIGGAWPDREARVESYLKIYQAADLVITPRLHCALPSLALGTPVVLIENFDEDFNIRLSDYTGYTVCCVEEDLLSGKTDEIMLHSVSGKDMATAAADSGIPHSATIPGQELTSMAAGLTETCRDFIRLVSVHEPDLSLLPEPSQYQKLYLDRTEYMRRAIPQLLGICLNLQKQHLHDLDVMNQVLATAQKIYDMTPGTP